MLPGGRHTLTSTSSPVNVFQTHCWDTFNPAEYTNAEYNPMEPGSYSWPLPGETDDHMSRFYVSRTMTSPPADPECDGFVPVEQPEAEADESQVGGVGRGATGLIEYGNGCWRRNMLLSNRQ